MKRRSAFTIGMLCLGTAPASLLTASNSYAAEFVAVEWKSQAIAQKFARGCGISLSRRPLEARSRRTYQTLRPDDFEKCPGLIRELPQEQYRNGILTLLQEVEKKTASLSLRPLEAPGSVDKVPLANLRLAASRIRFFEFPWGTLKPYSNRRGYVFLTNSKKVVVNSGNLASIQMEKQQLERGRFSGMLLHEALQAAGYYDKFYEFSLGLQLMAEAKPRDMPWLSAGLSDLADYLARNTKPVQVAGGCSLVCGGGDGNELYFKSVILDIVLKREEFQANPAIQRRVILKILRSEIHEILPSECALMKARGTARCSIYGSPKGTPGVIYFEGDWLLDSGSVPRMVEAATLVLRDISLEAQIEELQK